MVGVCALHVLEALDRRMRVRNISDVSVLHNKSLHWFDCWSRAFQKTSAETNPRSGEFWSLEWGFLLDPLLLKSVGDFRAAAISPSLS